jgi:eukaryotic-like serine/threonine-protein kinase
VSPSPLDRERWARLSPLLDQLLDLAPAEREAHLLALSGDDETLRLQLRRLLAADQAAGFLETGDAAAFHALAAGGEVEAPADERTAAGARIGPWEVVRELGRGGMGAVFLASRADGQFQQEAALKVVKRGMDTDEVLRRFLAERQILARLHHPHIARLLDGGVTDDGRPYFAMEYVEGTPIADYCAARALSPDARLGLWGDVCEAVQYAHRSLVVHRDLKPSNILVTADGQAKLLDFGIAKLLGRDDGLTQTGDRVLTPKYAAPEQLKGQPVTTATDVYTLALLLSELVEAQGDLHAILECALREEPERRYQSVEALADDVRRYRDGLPVIARKGSRLYRARKFARRHRVGVAATAVTLAALLAGLAGTLWQARVATAEAAKARAVTDFLVGVFEGSDPDLAKGQEITARDMLDRGAARIESELAGQPALAAELRGVTGRLYFRLGLHEQAGGLLDRDLALRRRLFGDDSVEVADSLALLGDLHHARGAYAEAETVLRRAHEIHRRRLGARHPRTTSDADALARSLIERGRYEEAEKIVDENLEHVRADRGTENEDYAGVLNTREMIFWAQGKYPEAQEVMRHVVDLRVRLLGDRHTLVAEGFSNLGSIAMARGDWAESERMYRRALAIQTDLYGADHPQLGITLNNLSKPVQERGDFQEAVALQRRALAARTRQLGEGSPQLAVNFHNLGMLLREQGNYEEATRLLRTAVDMNRRLLGDEHLSQAITFGSLGLVLADAGQHAEAEATLGRSIAVFRKKGLEKHMKFPDALEGLGLLLVRRGRAAEAETLLQEALDRRRTGLGEGSWRTAAAKGALGSCLKALGRSAPARQMASEALPVLRAQRGEAHPATRLAQGVLAEP